MYIVTETTSDPNLILVTNTCVRLQQCRLKEREKDRKMITLVLQTHSLVATSCVVRFGALSLILFIYSPQRCIDDLAEMCI